MEFNPSVSNGVPHQILKPTKGEGYDKIVVKVDGVYKAQLEESPFTGLGTCKFDGKSFCGKFEAGRFTFGTCEYSEKLSYHGNFENDLPHGKGIMTRLFEMNSSHTYKGSFDHGVSQPYSGELTYSNGTVYTGTFFPEILGIPTPTGKGKLTYTTGDVFEGEFLHGLPSYGQIRSNNQVRSGAFHYKKFAVDYSRPDLHVMGRSVRIHSKICREGEFIADQTKRTADGELTTDTITTKRLKHS